MIKCCVKRVSHVKFNLYFQQAQHPTAARAMAKENHLLWFNMLDCVCVELLACIIRRAVLLGRVQFVITRVILPVELSGKKRVRQDGDLSCARQRAMKGASLFIRFDQPCELWAVYINTRFSFTGRSSTSLGESFANYHSAYASTPTHAAYANGLRCIASRISRSNRYTFSPSPADDRPTFERH